MQNIKIKLPENLSQVSGIITTTAKPKLFLVLAHGAGADLNHNFMGKLSSALAEEDVAVLRYNFPYTEKKSKRIDSKPLLLETVRSAVKAAKEYADGLPIIAGGKSMGGRMTSMAASEKSLDGIKGIVFFGFPLHPPGKPGTERAEHLYRVNIPMLFLQGTRDKLAELDLLKPVINKLKNKAALHILEGADHSFHFLKSSGKNEDETLKEMAKHVVKWAENSI